MPEPNHALTEVLERELESQEASGDNEEMSSKFYDEHQARLKAESDAQDKMNRLRVAQEQMAEFTQHKHDTVLDILKEAENMEILLHNLPEEVKIELSKHLMVLKNKLSDDAQESKAFVALQHAEMESHKRSSREAEMLDFDTEMKRVRETSSDENEEDNDDSMDTATSKSKSTKSVSIKTTSSTDAVVAAAAAIAKKKSKNKSDSSSNTKKKTAGDPSGHEDGDTLLNDKRGDEDGDHEFLDASSDDPDSDDDSDSDGMASPDQIYANTDGVASSSTRHAKIPASLSSSPSSSITDAKIMADRARFIPMRLDFEDRRLLRLVEAALNVNEYTDKVDVVRWRTKNQRILAEIKDICAVLSGLVVAQDYRVGQDLLKDKNFRHNAAFFQRVFEIGRRYKIMNPDKMRSEYGKLLYMLMDSSDPAIQELLEFECVVPLKTVHSFLEERGGIAMLSDPLMKSATEEIKTVDQSRYAINEAIKVKEKARKVLASRYTSSSLREDDLLTAIYSISDNNSYLLFNRDPIDRMITYFVSFFNPRMPSVFTPVPTLPLPPSHGLALPTLTYSLGIVAGQEGARLTHSHERQYHYVLQSLSLWREITTEMFKLWYLGESDMLRASNRYRLCDTGQGLNRVQSAPLLGRAMHEILARVQNKIGSWVGSSVVHLGDHNVPNALMFIDKYTQVPRILNPIVAVLDEIPKICRKDEHVARYIDSTFGGVEACQRLIVTDFCRHAFDGSGADNFFDAGSCIDGRLTSAWNWCSVVEKKSFYPVFKLCGFVGFDGDFRG
eukprot:CAMPEP_0175067104 /NCGR_PEP_ID=MMETSP0052_2-20121109/16900_1 /TAXON_ID=51329 ORGANISM="Polytomella parva, Strain SAG 63-3" /NCGR_SAMPLE_ID=MMETSP0052_2 /ASSEMBLY_ACC=CAM_ASM_000194 /LENGTH=783 /DNA_ID=CAMNT_0016333923 /DNA_START=206 /DNA_END=2557 /DNA_ORIENTATION=+